MNLREFLTSPIAYLAPDKVLDGLTAAEAERKSPGVEHSIHRLATAVAFRLKPEATRGNQHLPASAAGS